MLLDKPYGRALDWWAFGIVLYQMMTAQSPFHGRDQDEICNAILTAEPPYPESLARDAADLMRKLLLKMPEERIGYQKGAEEIMEHGFFSSIDWDALYKKEVTPPFRPIIKDRNDLSNYDTGITSIDPLLTPINSSISTAPISNYKNVNKDLVLALSPTEQEQFRDFPLSFT